MGRYPSRLKPLTHEQRLEVLEEYKQYVLSTEDPLMAGFLGFNDVSIKYLVNKDNVYSWHEFNEWVKIADLKQEAYLVKSGANNQSAAMSIFRLKQPYLGYRDRVDQNVTSEGKPVEFVNTIPRPKAEDPQPKKK